MAKIEVYECPHCKEIYRGKMDYIKCRRKCRQEQIKLHNEQIVLDEFDCCRLNALNVDHFLELVKDTYNKYVKKNKILSIEYQALKWSNCVSNSHNSPVHGVQNWCNKHNDRPNGYPGWNGQIRIVYQKDPGWDNPAQDMVPGLNTCGGGSYRSDDGYGVKYGTVVYLEDFPLLHKEIQTATSYIVPLATKHKHYMNEMQNVHDQLYKTDPTILSIDKQIEENEQVIAELTEQNAELAKTKATHSSNLWLTAKRRVQPLFPKENEALFQQLNSKLRVYGIINPEPNTLGSIHPKVEAVIDIVK